MQRIPYLIITITLEVKKVQKPTNLRAQMKGVDVPTTGRRHVSMEVKGEVVSQEVTSSQSGTSIQSVLADVKADSNIRDAFK